MLRAANALSFGVWKSDGQCLQHLVQSEARLWLCTAALSPPDQVLGRHTLEELSRVRDATAQSLPVAAPGSPPTQQQESSTAGKVLTLSAKCLMIKALFDIRGFSKRAHLFKWVLYSFWAQESSEPFGI